MEILGGFASAICLLGVAVMMTVGSVERLLTPEPIRYREEMVVAALGLLVNLACAWILGRVHHHGNGHAQGHGQDTDLHVWRVGKQVYSCAMTVVTRDHSLTPALVREHLAVHEEIVHSTIEIHHLPPT